MPNSRCDIGTMSSTAAQRAWRRDADHVDIELAQLVHHAVRHARASSGRFLASPTSRFATMASAPPPCEKIHLMFGQRWNVPPNSRLVIARVVSNGNSMVGGGMSGNDD